VKWISGLIIASDNIHTNYFSRVVITTEGYKQNEPCHIGFEQLQTIQLEERALQFNDIKNVPSRKRFTKLPIGVRCQYDGQHYMTFSKQQDTHFFVLDGV